MAESHAAFVRPETPAHTLTEPEVLAAKATTLSGLTHAEAVHRLATAGPNALPEGRGRPKWRMLLDQFTDFMILVLVAAGVISAIVGEPVDSLVILIIVVLNGTIGFFQEVRAQNAMAALKRMAAQHSRVRRDGVIAQVQAHDLVVGDVVLLEAGDVVPADLRLVEVANLACGEAALTGESVPVPKTSAAIPDTTGETRVGDRHNMAFKGTLVTSGRGVGIVVAIGLQTELGKIARLLDAEDEVKTPLQKRLAAFGMKLAWVVLAICAIVFVAGLIRGEDPALMFLTAVSLAVAAIPEALPAVVVISLALGAARMVREQALIRRLPAVETLGSVTWVCSDKTGTLTQNRMQVEAVQVGGEPVTAPRELLEAMALVNDVEGAATVDALVGDPTEVALIAFAMNHGIDERDLAQRFPRLSEVPFDSHRKRMATAHRRDGKAVLYVKGAPEAVLARCRSERIGDDEVPLDLEERKADADAMAARGLRVLAVATRTLPDTLSAGGQPGFARPSASLDATADPAHLEHFEDALTLLGLVGLIDPPRAEAKDAVDACLKAGLTPAMITGDHPATALAIAQALGIAHSAEQVMTGDELARLSDDAFAAKVTTTRVYARVDPEQKIRIVKALQDHGELVAMTGDGVNDAPALKRADIGVAMGKGGTEVAREAAHMVLLDDNFATIARAIREGRRIFDNIRKFIRYAMTGNAAELLTILLAPFFGLPIPLLPVHILWVNLVTDGLPGLALTAEAPERNVMNRPPRHPRESIFAHGLWQHIVWVGLTIAALCLITQAISLGLGAHWQTMVFTVLCLSQLGHVIAVRSERDSVFSLPHNRFLTWTVIGSIGLQLATIYVPFLQPIFRTEALSALELGICFGVSTLPFIAVELEKWTVRHFGLYGEPRDP